MRLIKWIFIIFLFFGCQKRVLSPFPYQENQWEPPKTVKVRLSYRAIDTASLTVPFVWHEGKLTKRPDSRPPVAMEVRHCASNRLRRYVLPRHLKAHFLPLPAKQIKNGRQLK